MNVPANTCTVMYNHVRVRSRFILCGHSAAVMLSSILVFFCISAIAHETSASMQLTLLQPCTTAAQPRPRTSNAINVTLELMSTGLETVVDRLSDAAEIPQQSWKRFMYHVLSFAVLEDYGGRARPFTCGHPGRDTGVSRRSRLRTTPLACRHRSDFVS